MVEFSELSLCLDLDGTVAPDSLAAKAANVPCILMAYGYSTVPFEHLGADVVLRRFRDIPSALQNMHV